jgi:hypothetical protein
MCPQLAEELVILPRFLRSVLPIDRRKRISPIRVLAPDAPITPVRHAIDSVALGLTAGRIIRRRLRAVIREDSLVLSHFPGSSAWIPRNVHITSSFTHVVLRRRPSHNWEPFNLVPRFDLSTTCGVRSMGRLQVIAVDPRANAARLGYRWGVTDQVTPLREDSGRSSSRPFT